MIRERSGGECLSFLGIELNEGDYAYPEFNNMNLRGADFRDANFSFGDIQAADLAGANLKEFYF